MFNPKVSDLIKKIIELANDYKSEVYVVGGTVRDFFIGNATVDFDFAVNENAALFAYQFSVRASGKYILLDEDNDIARVVVDKGIIFDFARFKGKDIYEDLKKRDFTINSIGVAANYLLDRELFELNIIDPLNGLEDIRNGIIRVDYQNAFIDDPVRMLRCFRIASKYRFSIEEKTMEKIKDCTMLVLDCARERLWSEIVNIFSTNNSIDIIEKMDSTRILNIIIPEIDQMKEVGKCKYHVTDVWTHSKNLLNILEQFMISNHVNNEKYISLNDELLSYALGKLDGLKNEMNENLNIGITKAHSRIALLRIAALFHDVGKPYTYIHKNGKVGFKNHEKVGKDIIKNRLNKLRAANNEIKYVSNVVLYHMEFLNYYNRFYIKGILERRFLFELFENASDIIYDLMLLSFVDVASTYQASEKYDLTRKYIEYMKYVFNEYKIYKSITSNIKINGDFVCQYLNPEKVKFTGKILKDLYLWSYINEVINEEEQKEHIIKEILKYIS